MSPLVLVKTDTDGESAVLSLLPPVVPGNPNKQMEGSEEFGG